MNIAFLVGNGFDISVGIKSAYSDFYKWYVAQPSSTESIKQLKESINKYIKQDENGEVEEINVKTLNWSDFELGLGQYTQNFTTETVQDFYDCINDAQEKIVAYLRDRSASFDMSLFSKEEISELRNGVLNFYHELSEQERITFQEIFKNDEPNNTIIKFLSMNYTDALDKCAKILSEQPLKQWTFNTSKSLSVSSRVLHIHGTSSRFPILGVSNETQIANKTLLDIPDFKEIIMKPKCVEALGELWYNEVDKAISESRIIGILGTSLGETDSHFWKKIANWLAESSGRHLIIYWYSKLPPNNFSVVRKFRQTREIREKFFGYSDLPQEKQQALQQRIHVIFNTKSVLCLPDKIPREESDTSSSTGEILESLANATV